MKSINQDALLPASKKFDIAGKYVGSAAMALFGIIALVRWYESTLLFFLLLAFRDFLAAFFFLIRKDAVATAGWKESLIAYISAAMPLMYSADFSNPLFFTPATAILTSNILSIVGFLLVVLATIDLGDCLGVAPANRGKVVKSGVYKYLRHPMYVGYVVAEVGFVHLSLVNVFLLLVSVLLYMERISKEKRIIPNL